MPTPLRASRCRKGIGVQQYIHTNERRCPCELCIQKSIEPFESLFLLIYHAKMFAGDPCKHFWLGKLIIRNKLPKGPAGLMEQSPQRLWWPLISVCILLDVDATAGIVPKGSYGPFGRFTQILLGTSCQKAFVGRWPQGHRCPIVQIHQYERRILCDMINYQEQASKRPCGPFCTKPAGALAFVNQ